MLNNFIDLGSKLPEPLSNSEIRELFKQYKDGSLLARDKIIHYNLRLVISIIYEKYNYEILDMQELFSIGCEGLINAVDSFDLNQQIAFSTYATTCIYNKICLYFRKHKNDIQFISIEDTIPNNDSRENRIGDHVTSNDNFVEDYERQELDMLIKKYIINLDEREQKIICLYFGLYNDKNYTQRQISDKIGISRTMVCNIIKKFILNIRKMLNEENYLVLKNTISENKKDR